MTVGQARSQATAAQDLAAAKEAQDWAAQQQQQAASAAAQQLLDLRAELDGLRASLAAGAARAGQAESAHSAVQGALQRAETQAAALAQVGPTMLLQGWLVHAFCAQLSGWLLRACMYCGPGVMTDLLTRMPPVDCWKQGLLKPPVQTFLR